MKWVAAKFAPLVLFLLYAPSLHAALFLSVDGEVDPQLDITLNQGEEAILGIHGDGKTAPHVEMFLLVQGPAAVDGSTMVYLGSFSSYVDSEEIPDDLVPSLPDLYDLSWLILGDVTLAPPLEGLLVDNINFRCEGIGDITLSLVSTRSSDFGTIYDTQVIHQIPEPMSVLLFAVGGLLLRKRV